MKTGPVLLFKHTELSGLVVFFGDKIVKSNVLSFVVYIICYKLLKCYVRNVCLSNAYNNQENLV